MPLCTSTVDMKQFVKLKKRLNRNFYIHEMFPFSTGTLLHILARTKKDANRYKAVFDVVLEGEEDIRGVEWEFLVRERISLDDFLHGSYDITDQEGNVFIGIINLWENDCYLNYPRYKIKSCKLTLSAII